MMPLHDRSRERSAIRERMAAIEDEMTRLGGLGDGPGHYALGRGYLTLLDEQKALRHLQLAIDRGYSGPGVSYALGLVLGRLYERGSTSRGGSTTRSCEPPARRDRTRPIATPP